MKKVLHCYSLRYIFAPLEKQNICHKSNQCQDGLKFIAIKSLFEPAGGRYWEKRFFNRETNSAAICATQGMS